MAFIYLANSSQWGLKSFREPPAVKLILNFFVNNRLYARFQLPIHCYWCIYQLVA